MLSEIERPPRTAATPRITPSDWRIERVRFSRISTHELRSRSRKAPLKVIGGRRSRRFGDFDQPVVDLDLAPRHPGDREVVRDDDDRVALAVQLGEKLEDFVARLRVERAPP